MIRNQAGQVVNGELINATTGADFVGTVTCSVLGDAGTLTVGTVGSGICTSKGNGVYQYAPSAAETDFAVIAFNFKGTGAITATTNVATVTAAQNAAISSSTATGAVTVADLIRLALMRVNILQAGGTPTSEDQADSFTILNLWLDALSIERLMIPFIQRTLWTLTSTKGTPTNPYTVGSGGDINVAKPSFIDHVNYLNNAVSPAVEIPLGVLTSDMYSGVVSKTQTSTLPTAAYYQPTYTNNLGSLYLWPVPSQSSLQGALYAPSALAQFGSVSDSVIVPAGYKKFLVDGLAIELGSTLRENLPIDPMLIRNFNALKSTIKTVNTPQQDMSFDPALTLGSSVWSNIYTSGS